MPCNAKNVPKEKHSQPDPCNAKNVMKEKHIQLDPCNAKNAPKEKHIQPNPSVHHLPRSTCYTCYSNSPPHLLPCCTTAFTCSTPRLHRPLYSLPLPPHAPQPTPRTHAPITTSSPQACEERRWAVVMGQRVMIDTDGGGIG